MADMERGENETHETSESIYIDFCVRIFCNTFGPVTGAEAGGV